MKEGSFECGKKGYKFCCVKIARPCGETRKVGVCFFCLDVSARSTSIPSSLSSMGFLLFFFRFGGFRFLPSRFFFSCPSSFFLKPIHPASGKVIASREAPSKRRPRLGHSFFRDAPAHDNQTPASELVSFLLFLWPTTKTGFRDIILIVLTVVEGDKKQNSATGFRFSCTPSLLFLVWVFLNFSFFAKAYWMLD